MRDPNEARGEVALRVGGEDLIICAEMDRLARVSAALRSMTLHELYQRMTGAEPLAVLAALRNLTVAGDAEKAIANLKLPDLLKVGAALVDALAAHMKDEDAGGNAQAGAETS